MQGPLTLANVQIPVTTWTKVAEAKFPPLKKMSGVAAGTLLPSGA